MPDLQHHRDAPRALASGVFPLLLAALALCDGFAHAEPPIPPAKITYAVPLDPASGPDLVTLPAPQAEPVLEEPIPPAQAWSVDSERELPATFAPWWQNEMRRALKQQSHPIEMTLDNVVIGTLMHSPQVKVFSDTPIIRRTSIMEAQGKFDVHQFAESKFVDTSDPVGSTLTTGGANRFIDQNVYASAGLRRQSVTGAQVEASQKIGYQQNNSIYFVPPDQGTARLTLSVTQPLLNGRGQAYNTSMVILARIDTSVARDELSLELQKLLLELHQTYWDLYLQRAVLLQKRRLYAEAVGIRDELHARRDIDVIRSQLVRADAAVAMREAATIRFQSTLRNAESRLRALVNDPVLIPGNVEMVPCQMPNHAFLRVDLQESLVTALESRPEVNQAAKEVRAACVRLNVSKNELLPMLNLVLGTYVYGLQGNAELGQAYVNQFGVGRPTYSAGFLFDVPYGNHVAKARYEARRVEMRQLTNQLQATTNKIRCEVEIAVRDVETSYREMISKYHAMLANQAEIDYLSGRWQLLPGEDQQVAGIVLDDLLNAQERLAEAEAGFVQSVVAYNVSLVALRRVTGTLLDYEEVRYVDRQAEALPVLEEQPAREDDPPSPDSPRNVMRLPTVR